MRRNTTCKKFSCKLFEVSCSSCRGRAVLCNPDCDRCKHLGNDCTGNVQSEITGMKKPNREEYYNSPHLSHLSPEAREELFMEDSNKYKQSSKIHRSVDLLDFSETDIDEEEILP